MEGREGGGRGRRLLGGNISELLFSSSFSFFFWLYLFEAFRAVVQEDLFFGFFKDFFRTVFMCELVLMFYL